MTRTLRGLRARGGPLATLFAMTAVVVAGTVAVVGFAAAAGTSVLLAAPLLLLGLVAVPGTGRELGAVRRDEIALARLRGLRGARLVRTIAAEPLLVILAGAVVGLPVGAVAAAVCASRWLAGASAPLTSDALLATAAVVVVGLVAVLAGMARSLREPLADQLGSLDRPRSATIAGVFGSLLVLAAAAVAIYRSGSADGADPDAVVLLGPAVVGLAAGQLAVWAVQLAAAAAVRRTDASALPPFLAVRRLARAADRVTPIRLLVAVAALAAVALTGAAAVSDWTSTTGRLRAGAPLVVPVDLTAAGALALTDRLDPEGQWLMAAVVVPSEEASVERRAYLDTRRYDAVASGFLAGTPASGLVRDLAGLRHGPTPVLGTAATLQIGLRDQVGDQGAGPVGVTVRYVDDTDSTMTATTRLAVGPGVTAPGIVRLAGCTAGCSVAGIALRQLGAEDDRAVVVTRLQYGGQDLTQGPLVGATVSAAGPVLTLPQRGPVDLLSDGGQATLPVVTTPHVAYETAGVVSSPGGDDWRASVVGTSTGLPLVDGTGAVADLPRALVGSSATVPGAQVEVLARDGVPAAMLSGLVAAGGSRPRTLATVTGEVSRASGSAQARMYGLMAVVCLPLALLVLAAAAARQRRQVTVEVAALRLVGVERHVVRRAGRIELLVLVLAALVGAASGALVGILLLLPHLPLVRLLPLSTPLHVGFAPVPFVVVLVVAAAGLWWLGGRARRVPERRSRPARLREGSLR